MTTQPCPAWTVLLACCLGLALLPPPAAAQSGGGGFSAQLTPPAQLWGPLSPGQASVSTAAELLQALSQNVGEIILQSKRGDAHLCRFLCALCKLWASFLHAWLP